jgi:two-component system response regulator PilR (NtrC family)
MVVLASGARLGLADLPPQVGATAAGCAALDGFELPAAGLRLGELERHLILQALRRSRGNVGVASRLLGISYKTLQYRIRKHGLDREGLDGPG